MGFTFSWVIYIVVIDFPLQDVAQTPSDQIVTGGSHDELLILLRGLIEMRISEIQCLESQLHHVFRQ